VGRVLFPAFRATVQAPAGNAVPSGASERAIWIVKQPLFYGCVSVPTFAQAWLEQYALTIRQTGLSVGRAIC